MKALTSLLILFALSAGAQIGFLDRTTVAVVPSGLIRFWKINGGTRTIVPDGFGGNGNLVNPAVLARSPAGLGLDCSGSNYFLFPAIPIDAGDYSWAAWLKRKSGRGGNYQSLFTDEDTKGLFLSSGVFQNYPSSSGYSPPDNTWVYLTFVRSASSSALYANGVAVGNLMAGGASLRPNNALGDRANEWFSGVIADIRVYNLALSTNEIQSLYLAGH